MSQKSGIKRYPLRCARAPYQAAPWLNLNVYFKTTDGQNDLFAVNAWQHDHATGLDVSLTPTEKFSAQLGLPVRKTLDRTCPLGLLRLPRRFERIISGLVRTAKFQGQLDYAVGSIRILKTEGKRDGSSPKFIRGEQHGK